MLITLIMVILQYKLSYHILHLKHMQFLFVNYISKKMGEKKRSIQCGDKLSAGFDPGFEKMDPLFLR